MAAFQSKDPALAARVYSLIESGLSSEDVAKALIDDNVTRELQKTEGRKTFAEEEETFPNEIKVIAQALAYRAATQEDVPAITRLLSAAYRPEVELGGTEAFRVGAEAVTQEAVEAIFQDPSYQWQLVEAPCGRDVELDGVLLGACCFSTDGVSRRNGQVEGALGSMRYLAVLPRFHGVCVGLRLLRRVEQLMERAKCVRSMACVPSTRTSMCTWLERRGYRQAGGSPYPASALGHQLRDDCHSVQLTVFIKPIDGAVDTADDKSIKPKTILSTVNINANDTSADAQQPPSSPAARPPEVKGKMHLPPHWRYSSSSLVDPSEPKSSSNVDDEDIPLD